MCGQLVKYDRFKCLAELWCLASKEASLQRGDYSGVEEVIFRRAQRLTLQGLAPRRQFVQDQCVFQDLEVLVYRCARDLRIIGDLCEIDDGGVAERCYFQKAAERRGITSRPLSHDLLLQISACICLKVGARIVGEID